MDTSTVLRSFQHSVATVQHARPFHERPGMAATSRKLYVQGLSVGGKLTSSPARQKGMLVSCLKTPDATKVTNSSDNISQGLVEKKSLNATFPTEFEDLVLEVCDETEVAELTLKVGEFEMYMKRNVGATKASVSASPTISPPAPSEPLIKSVPQITPPPSKGALVMKSRKLLALEASGASGYDFVDSPKIGEFRRGRFRKGKKFPPICKPGDVVKKGQVIGYIYYFKMLIPVRTDKAGEVLRFLIDDEEPLLVMETISLRSCRDKLISNCSHNG